MKTPNAQYNVAAPGSLAIRVAGRMRKRMYNRFLATTGIGPEHSVLDVGATSDTTYDHSNYFESWYPYKDRIIAVGTDNASFLEARYPGLRYVRANGLRLPFRDRSFDYIHSSAVIEHVGSAARQQQFISELFRVSRRGVFVTTPNRWFPVEFHAVLPLVHWLPKPLFRAILNAMGHSLLAREENLNLLDRLELRRHCRELGLPQAQISSVRLMGLSSNLLLFVAKDSEQ